MIRPMKYSSPPFLALALLFAVFLGNEPHAEAIPSTTGTLGGYAYEVITDDGITWTDAETAAKALGSGWDLVSITSQTESDYIKTLLATHNPAPLNVDHFWIGLKTNDAPANETFVWNSGEAFLWEDWWSGSDPQPTEGLKGGFVALRLYGPSTWAWNDIPDAEPNYLQYHRGHIAEKYVPDSGSTLVFLALGILGLVGMRRRFAK